MDMDRFDELARDPRFIPGVYALIGIERSIAAWATVLRRFPDHEDAIHALAALKRLLRQVEAAFPNARASRRPGFDTEGT